MSALNSAWLLLVLDFIDFVWIRFMIYVSCIEVKSLRRMKLFWLPVRLLPVLHMDYTARLSVLGLWPNLLLLLHVPVLFLEIVANFLVCFLNFLPQNFFHFYRVLLCLVQLSGKLIFVYDVSIKIVIVVNIRVGRYLASNIH